MDLRLIPQTYLLLVSVKFCQSYFYVISFWRQTCFGRGSGSVKLHCIPQLFQWKLLSFFSVAGFHCLSVKSVVNLFFFCLWVLQAFFLNYKRKAEIKQIDCGTHFQNVESGFFIQFAPNAKTLLSAESKTSMS